MGEVDFRVVDDPAEEAARLIADAATAGGHIGLSGGSGPRPAYERAGILCRGDPVTVEKARKAREKPN